MIDMVVMSFIVGVVVGLIWGSWEVSSRNGGARSEEEVKREEHRNMLHDLEVRTLKKSWEAKVKMIDRLSRRVKELEESKTDVRVVR